MVNIFVFCFTIIILGLLFCLIIDKFCETIKNEEKNKTMQIIIKDEKDLQKFLKKLEQDFKELKEE